MSNSPHSRLKPILGKIGLYLFALLLLPAAHAADTPNWQPCVEMQNKDTADNELNCYRQAANEKPAEPGTQKSLVPYRATRLAQEWAPNNDPLTIYKQNYVMVYSHSSEPNNTPTSPNPQNQALTATPQDNRDLKFQFSMKHDLADFDNLGSLWFGYTQLSFWQFYDESNSRPFRENNYEPEIIYSLIPDNLIHNFALNPSVLNFGLVHQSNGQSNPRSRSWNRLYIQPGIEHNYGGGHRLVVLARLWQRIKEDPATDDNPDITDYMGYGDIEVRYSQNSMWEASVIARTRAVQVDLSAPWTAWRLLTVASPGEHNTNIHLQYFSGYGESLIDYNQKHETWGIGLSFPFD
jgi:phospholipase A1